MHTPVLLEETLKALDIKSTGRYIDATAGEGGHLKKILEKGGTVLAIDVDYEQIAGLKEALSQNKGLILAQGNFADIESIATKHGFDQVDGIIYDLGLSMRQIDSSKRGFSYKQPNDPLDMRLDPEQETTAADLINSLDADQLYEIFTKNSEELGSRAIAEAVYSARRINRIETVGDLLRVFERLGSGQQVRARIFQALRIEVNKEKENLEKGLRGGLNLLKSGGKLAVITFHSLEDRWAKRFTKENEEEIESSELIRGGRGRAFERSAKLRIIVKK